MKTDRAAGLWPAALCLGRGDGVVDTATCPREVWVEVYEVANEPGLKPGRSRFWKLGPGPRFEIERHCEFCGRPAVDSKIVEALVAARNQGDSAVARLELS